MHTVDDNFKYEEINPDATTTEHEPSTTFANETMYADLVQNVGICFVIVDFMLWRSLISP